MTSKNTLVNYRLDVFNLLKRRSRFIDPRSYNAFERDVFKVQRKNLENVRLVLKGLKKLNASNEVVLTKKNFKDIFEKLNQTYKITIYGNYSVKFKNKIERSQEALETFEFKGDNEKKMMNEIRRRKAELYKKHYETDDYYDNKIRKLESFHYEKSPVVMQNIPLNRIPMRNAYVLHRDWLKYAEGITEQSYKNMNGQCVYELLSTHLSDVKRRMIMSKQKLFDAFKCCHSQMTGIRDLDFGSGKPFNELTMNDGVSTEMVKYLCEKYKISMYAFDGKQNCFEKLVYPKSSYRPIAYYCIDGHMYLITDTKYIKSLSESNKAENNVLMTSLLDMEEQKQKEDIIFTEANTFDEALSMENAFVYVPASQITDEVHQYISQHKSIPLMKTHGHSIVRVNIADKKLSIVCDPNLTDGFTWKEIQAVCLNADIKFNNQTIGSLISELKVKYEKSLVPDRRTLNQKEKDELIKSQCNLCALCQLKTIEFDFDHKVPLASGGSNEDSNFQALCKTCHAHKCTVERDSGDYIKSDDCSSSFNDEALKIVHSHHAKHWAFIDKLAESNNEIHSPTGVYALKSYKIDHSKCRRNLVMHSQFDFPKFSVMDYPTVYDGGDIKCGYYFVESDNYFPLRGNGWYNYTLIKYCIEQNIKIKITHQFTSSYTLKNDHFKSFVEYLINACGSNNMFAKKIINSMVGCWNINKTKYEQIGFTLDKYEASRELCRDNVMVTSTDLEDMTLYSIIENKVIKKDDLCSPLYHQVLAMEAIELHKLQTFIIKQGGTPLELNTDSILYSGSKINIDGHFYDKECQVEKYRYDETSKLKIESVCRMARTGSASIKEFNYSIITSENREFIDIVNDVITSNKGCLLTGIAGTGKTYLGNMLVAELEKQGKVVGKKLAPTNKASSHIKGETIHKFFMSLMLSQNYEKKLLKSLNNYDYIVVDEISMVKEVFYRFFTIIRRYAPKVKFIIIGDFEQFKPVQDTYEGTYEHSPALHQLCDGQRVNLTTCKRSDAELFNIYSNKENIKNIDVELFKVKELTPLNIAYTHKTRKNINKKCMAKFSGDAEFLTCGKAIYNKKTQDVKIYVGLPIVAYKNMQKENIFNSEVYHIESIDMNDKTFSLMVGDEVKTMKAHEFKNMFYPAYCITAHVSQGCTFETPYTIHDWNHPRMDITAKYVALSRATKINNIQIKV